MADELDDYIASAPNGRGPSPAALNVALEGAGATSDKTALARWMEACG